MSSRITLMQHSCTPEKMNKLYPRIVLLFFALWCATAVPAFGEVEQTSDGQLSVAGYPSLQTAIDANPGKTLYVPPGEYRLTEKLRLRGHGSGLTGHATIIQTHPEHPVIEIQSLDSVILRDLTLTRSEGAEDTRNEGVLAIDCKDLLMDNLKVLNNRTNSSAIALRSCNGSRIEGCLVRNYMRISVDDRTGNPDWGYAFRCTDGTGIGATECRQLSIINCRVIEDRLVPTPELRDMHGLGDFVSRNPQKGNLVNQTLWDSGRTDNWQQGSGIFVSSPEFTEQVLIQGNQVMNAAQGIDLHCDRVIVTGNLVSNSFIGMKAMHGSRNVLIQGNQFSRNSLWAIGLMPGVSSHAQNTDGGSIIANNIVSQFGEGDASWIWELHERPFGLIEDSNQMILPSITSSSRQRTGCPRDPRYAYAVLFDYPQEALPDVQFGLNLFPAGTEGVTNRLVPSLPNSSDR